MEDEPIKEPEDNNSYTEDDYCWACHGTGEFMTERGWRTCERCKGTGRG